MGKLLAKRIWVCQVCDDFSCKSVEEMFEHLRDKHERDSKLWGHQEVHSTEGDD